MPFTYIRKTVLKIECDYTFLYEEFPVLVGLKAHRQAGNLTGTQIHIGNFQRYSVIVV